MGRKEKATDEDAPSWIERQVLKLIYNKIIKKIEKMKGSWKTTLAGWAVLLVAVGNFTIALVDNDPTTKPDPKEIIDALTLLGLAIPAWIGLLLARDKSVSTEEQRRVSARG